MSSNTRCSGLSRQRGYSTSRMASAFSRSNPIENVLDALGRQVAGRNYPPTNKNTLIRALTEEWDKLPQQLLDNVVQNVTVMPFQQQSVCELLQRFLYLFETPCKSPAEGAEIGTVLMSHRLVEMPDIERSVDSELKTALVSQELCELPHAPPVQTFAVRLVETFR
ncbi:hypothetical protein TNCV_677201 [Trichonephila clavipes]|nr:hypothetical protein TNCV_677201 [Trichonephila clavipes]